MVVVKESLSRMLGFNNNVRNEQVKDIDINIVKPNPFQPRKYFDVFQLEELAKSIKEYGVIQPIMVRKKDDYFEIIAGERRFRASQKLGNKTIPAIVRKMTDRDVAEVALIENLQREDLNFFEEAEGYKRLIQEFNLTQDDVAKRVGKSQSTIANKLRILKLPTEIRENISTDVITERHARALLKVEDKSMQLSILKEIYENELNVRETDNLIATFLEHRCQNAEDKKQKRIVRVVKDIRICINTIKNAVKTIKETGIKVSMQEKECGEYVEVTIRIKKPKK